MKKLSFRNHRRKRNHMRIRNRIQGTSEMPRLCVFRSLKHTYAQLIDDQTGRTLASASSLKIGGKKIKHGSNVEAAKQVGLAVAGVAKKQGIERAVFDRAGYIYHGRVKAVADAAREGGLKF